MQAVGGKEIGLKSLKNRSPYLSRTAGKKGFSGESRALARHWAPHGGAASLEVTV
jgi:hypothetical protein